MKMCLLKLLAKGHRS